MPQALPWRLGLVLLAAGLQTGSAATALAASLQTEGGCPASAAVRELELNPAQPAPMPLQPAVAGTYSDRLRPTPAGWPVRDHWCVWVEPPSAATGTAAAARERQWQMAVEAALQQWRNLLSIELVERADQAQVRLWRRRPPLQRLADGRTRASHGRAVLLLLEVQRDGRWQVEPRVEVLLSPGQAPLPLQATALHELGHAFGLWGHSDQTGDAMAAIPGAQPVLELSPRDRATLHWLQRLDWRLQTPPGPAKTRPAAPTQLPVPRAD